MELSEGVWLCPANERSLTELWPAELVQTSIPFHVESATFPSGLACEVTLVPWSNGTHVPANQPGILNCDVACEPEIVRSVHIIPGMHTPQDA